MPHPHKNRPRTGRRKIGSKKRKKAAKNRKQQLNKFKFWDEYSKEQMFRNVALEATPALVS